MTTLASPDVAAAALERTQQALAGYTFDQAEIYYTFADKSIVPTYLTAPLSRQAVDTGQTFRTLRGDASFFPAFGASMSFMRARFARDVAQADAAGNPGGVHILPRVGFSDAERLADIGACAEVPVGMALGIHEAPGFLKAVLARENVQFVSIDIAHGANAAVLPVLAALRALGAETGVILGNVGSVEGFLYAYWLMKLSGLSHPIIKVGVGPGSVCTTRINTGVGVGQFTLLEHIHRLRQALGLADVQIISDGGVNAAGDFVKALARSDGVMMGKFFASGSFEDSVLDLEGRDLKGVHLYGMASAMVTEKRNYIEGSSQTLKSFHRDAREAVRRLREGLQSAMTYVNARTLEDFRGQVRFATNSHASIIEGGVH